MAPEWGSHVMRGTGRIQSIGRGACGLERILGGHDAKAGEFPWVAAIWLEGIQFCGGSLISPLYILTAAHCVTGFNNFSVVMGAHDLRDSSETTRQTRKTTVKIIHEDYDPEHLRNDIALLRLKLPFFLTPWIRTIRLPFSGDSSTFETATLTGWGLKGNDAPGLSTILQKLTFNIIDNDDCAKTLPDDILKDSHLCTNATRQGAACLGDSGGALTVTEDDGRTTQIGIDSFSGGKCGQGYPDVFTRLSSYVAWIRIKTGYLIDH